MITLIFSDKILPGLCFPFFSFLWLIIIIEINEAPYTCKWFFCPLDNHSIGLLAQIKRPVCSFYSSLLHLSYDTQATRHFLVYWSQQRKHFIGNFRLFRSFRKVLSSSRSRTSRVSYQAGNFKRASFPNKQGFRQVMFQLKQAISLAQRYDQP